MGVLRGSRGGTPLVADGYLEKVPDNIPETEPEPFQVSSGRHCGCHVILFFCFIFQEDKKEKLRNVSFRVFTLEAPWDLKKALVYMRPVKLFAGPMRLQALAETN